jgi:hypothetical protein
MTVVHYTRRAGTEPSLGTLPWVAVDPPSSQIIGHLFYYAVPGVPWRSQRTKGLRIYPHGVVPGSGGASTKILWIDHSSRARGTLTVDAERLDASGQFHQSFAELGPSIIDVPSSGCWRLTLHTRTTTGAVTLLATEM